MRNRSKKIVLVQSINTCRTEKLSKFIEHKDQVISMRIYHHQVEPEGHLAQIFYEALLNESITNKIPKQIQRQTSFKSTTLQTDASEKSNNYGKIVRRSLSKNCSQSSTPEKEAVKLMMPKEAIKRNEGNQGSKVQLVRRISLVNEKQNRETLYSSCQKIQSSRRSVSNSNRKQIKYKVKPAIRL